MSQCLGWQGRIVSALRHIVGLACASELPDPLSRHPMASSDGPLRVRLEYSEPNHWVFTEQSVVELDTCFSSACSDAKPGHVCTTCLSRFGFVLFFVLRVCVIQ